MNTLLSIVQYKSSNIHFFKENFLKIIVLRSKTQIAKFFAKKNKLQNLVYLRSCEK